MDEQLTPKEKARMDAYIEKEYQDRMERYVRARENPPPCDCERVLEWCDGFCGCDCEAKCSGGCDRYWGM